MAPVTDHILLALVAVSVLVLGLVFFLILFFCIRYRAGHEVDRSAPHGKSWYWEISWTAATLLAFVALFFWGANVYARLFTAPPNATDIYVVGKQWMWKIQHPDGQTEINELHVPVGGTFRLILASQDVIHSFFVPAFRIKKDAVPGHYESLWFTPTRTGSFDFACSEYCGTDHARMRGRIIVMTAPDFVRWLASRGNRPTLVAQGAALFRAMGCSGCHGHSATVHAPDLAGLYGRDVPLSDGTFVTADDRYIRDSILLPGKEVAAGYPDIMPSFAGKLTESEIIDLIAYIKSLSAAKEPAP